jgi:hypothetical protein
MAFLRFTRDKRGYEQFSLVEPTTNRRGKSRQRLLYWYRTPPNVRVGREPFDESVRRALEAQNPTIQFDWRKIAETPIPSAETERWRERRRLERAEKSARRNTVDEDQFAESEEGEPSALSTDATVTENPVEGEAVGDANSVARKRRRRRGRRGRQLGAGEAAGQRPPPAEDQQTSAPSADTEPTDENVDSHEE